MNEQEVSALSRSRVPDRIVMTTCGTKTPKPFECGIYIFEGALVGQWY
jgi:hypothetical protein